MKKMEVSNTVQSRVAEKPEVFARMLRRRLENRLRGTALEILNRTSDADLVAQYIQHNAAAIKHAEKARAAKPVTRVTLVNTKVGSSSAPREMLTYRR